MMTGSILEKLGQADEAVLLWVNGHQTAWLDSVMLFVSNMWVWLPLYVAVIWCMARKPKGWWWALSVVLCVFATWCLCYLVLQPDFGRLRPCDPENPIYPLMHFVGDYTEHSFGFPSCHAATTWAGAVFTALFFRRRWVTWAMLLWACLVCYSRMYLGVHYPSDLIGGALIGSAFAYAFYFTFRKILSH